MGQGLVPRRIWSWQRKHVELFISWGISTPATIWTKHLSIQIIQSDLPRKGQGRYRWTNTWCWALTHQIGKSGRGKKTEICEIVTKVKFSQFTALQEEQEGHNPSTTLNVIFPISLLAQVLLTCLFMPDVPTSQQLRSPHQKHHQKQRGASLTHRMPASTQPSQWGPPSLSSPPCWAIPTWPSGEGLGLLGGSHRNLGYCRHTPRKHSQTLSKS